MWDSFNAGIAAVQSTVDGVIEKGAAALDVDVDQLPHRQAAQRSLSQSARASSPPAIGLMTFGQLGHVETPM